VKRNNVTCIHEVTKCRQELLAWESIDDPRVSVPRSDDSLAMQFGGRRTEGL